MEKKQKKKQNKTKTKKQTNYLSHLELKGINHSLNLYVGFLGGSHSKGTACNVRDWGLIHEWGRSGGGNGYPLWYSCLKNSMGRGTWRATVHGVAESDWTEQLTQ